MHKLAVNQRPSDYTHKNIQPTCWRKRTVTLWSCSNSRMSSLILLQSWESSLVGPVLRALQWQSKKSHSATNLLYHSARLRPCARNVQLVAPFSCDFQESARWQGHYGDSVPPCCERVHSHRFNCSSLPPNLVWGVPFVMKHVWQFHWKSCSVSAW